MSISKVVGLEFLNRRRDRRVIMPPIDLEFEGDCFTTADWSLGGFLVEPYTGHCMPGTVFKVTIVVIAGDDIYRHHAEAEVVRMDSVNHQLAARYTRLSPEAVSTLESLQIGRLRRAGAGKKR